MPSHDGVGAKTPPRPDHLPNRRNRRRACSGNAAQSTPHDNKSLNRGSLWLLKSLSVQDF